MNVNTSEMVKVVTTLGLSHALLDEDNNCDKNDVDGIRTCDDEHVRAARYLLLYGGFS